MSICDENVSLVVGCHNRIDFLIKSIHSWLIQPKITEIVIVDWGSSKHVKEELEFLDNLYDTKQKTVIKIIRVNNVGKWFLSLALNIGVKYTTNQLLLKVDADTILKKDFFNSHPLTTIERKFYSGNWRNARTENEKHLNGVFYTQRHEFSRIGGYNEFLREYGWDDTDLYERLCANGMRQLDLNNNSLSHISHTDKIRSESSDLKLKIMENSYIAKVYEWSLTREQTKYIEIGSHLLTGNPFITLEPIDIEKNIPSSKDLAECSIKAIRSILHEKGFPWESTERKDRTILVKLYHNINLPKLVIKPLNGLGNRIRALSSAAVIAKNTNHNLLIVWAPDFHYEAKFHEHFDDSNLFVTSYTDPSKFSTQTSSFNGSTSNPEIIDNIPNGDVYITSSNSLQNKNTSWSEECEWLAINLQPIDSIQKKINYYSNLFKIERCNGLHVRMGQDPSNSKYEDNSKYPKNKKIDMDIARKNSNYIYFMEEAEKEWQKDSNQSFFLCGDSDEIYQAFHDKYPDKVGHSLFYIQKQVYNRSSLQITEAIIDAYLLSKCNRVYGSPWSSYTELVSRLGQKNTKISGKHFGIKKYAILFYPNSYNIGDDIQTISAMRFLPVSYDYLVDRDNQNIIYNSTGKNQAVLKDGSHIKIIENGWFDGRFTKFPPHTRLSPLFISFHLNETPGLLETPLYKSASKLATPSNKLLNNDVIDYFKSNNITIGTRDTHSLKIFQEHGIKSFHSCCLTLTLNPTFLGFNNHPKREEIISVDAHKDEKDLYVSLIPSGIKSKAVHINHALPDLYHIETKHALAKKLLERYYNAKLVITNRLHAALPCLAFGTPVIFLHANMDCDVRFDKTFIELLGNGHTIPIDFNWSNPTISDYKTILVKKLAGEAIKRVTEFIDG